MTSTIIKFIQMAIYLHPEYKYTFQAIQEECKVFSHQVDGLSLKLAVSIICTQSPMMVEAYPESYRLEVEKVLLSDLEASSLH